MNSFIKIASTGLMLCSLSHLVAQKTAPRDAVYEQTSVSERPTLAYAPLREADVMWEDCVWRDIKPEEKINAHFTHPTSSLFWCLFKLSDSSNIHLYKTDEFKEEFKEHNRLTVWTEIDTILFYDPEILNEVEQIVYTEPNSLGTLRLKEVWFFDEQHSTMSVRILGIAPMEDNYDDRGNALFSYARCWFYYPEIRPYLSHCIAYTSDNERPRQPYMGRGAGNASF